MPIVATIAKRLEKVYTLEYDLNMLQQRLQQLLEDHQYNNLVPCELCHDILSKQNKYIEELYRIHNNEIKNELLIQYERVCKMILSFHNFTKRLDILRKKKIILDERKKKNTRIEKEFSNTPLKECSRSPLKHYSKSPLKECSRIPYDMSIVSSSALCWDGVTHTITCKDGPYHCCAIGKDSLSKECSSQWIISVQKAPNNYVFLGIIVTYCIYLL